MKTGKISESILKRSVLRLMKNHRDEVTKGAGVGEDCAFLSWKDADEAAVSTQTITLDVKDAGYLAVMAAANNVFAAGAKPLAALLALTLPSKAQETDLKEMMKSAELCCKELDIEIAGGHTEVSDAVKAAIVTATVLGKPMQGSGQCKTQHKEKDSAQPILQPFVSETGTAQMDIVVSKWIGMEGTYLLAKEKEQELAERYPASLIRLAKDCGKHLSIGAEAKAASESQVYAMHDIRSGGIFGGLWELSQKLRTGLTVDLKKIPIRQETVEVCEFFELNPYELLSGGALLMVTEDGEALAERLQRQGIPAAWIGKTNAGNDKIIINQDETRYLEPAVRDEIFKVNWTEKSYEEA